CAPFARCTHDTDLAAKQARDFATDGQSKSGTTILSAGAHIGLLEWLENELQFIRGNANSGVGRRERDHDTGSIQYVVIRAPAIFGHFDLECYLAAFGKLERIRQKVLEYLLQACAIGRD